MLLNLVILVSIVVHRALLKDTLIHLPFLSFGQVPPSYTHYRGTSLKGSRLNPNLCKYSPLKQGHLTNQDRRRRDMTSRCSDN